MDAPLVAAQVVRVGTPSVRIDNSQSRDVNGKRFSFALWAFATLHRPRRVPFVHGRLNARSPRLNQTLASREGTLDSSQLFLGVLFGAIGLGFFIYGKKQQALVPLVCGLALMTVPYFISNNLLLVAVGVALVAVPYFVRL